MGPVFLMFLAIVAYHAFLAFDLKKRLLAKKKCRINEMGNSSSIDETIPCDPQSNGGTTYSALENNSAGVYKYNPVAELREPLLEK